MDTPMGFNGKTRDELFESLGSSADGLTSDEATGRRKKHGLNQLVFHRQKSPLIMFLEEFKGMFPVTALNRDAGEGVILVGPIEIGAYLAKPQMAWRKSPHEIRYDEMNRWAEPLRPAAP